MPSTARASFSPMASASPPVRAQLTPKEVAEKWARSGLMLPLRKSSESTP